MKKGLVGSVNLLFSVPLSPQTSTRVFVKASVDDDLIEVTTQVCGIQGSENTTVKLTREQYQNLAEIINGSIETS